MKQSLRPRCRERVCTRDVDHKDIEKKSTDLITKKRKMKLIIDYLHDYTENSNLHGLKYLGEKKRTPVERIFWAFTITCSVIICAILIRKIWIKWDETPVIVTFAEKSTPVWHIPFPAVTICSEIKSVPHRFNYTKYFHLYYNGNLTDEETDMFEHVAMVCGHNMPRARGKKFSVNIIKKVSPNVIDLFRGCELNQEEFRYCNMFRPILTEEGLCYTFNTLGAEELLKEENLAVDYKHLYHRNSNQTWWNLETGYSSSAPSMVYPRRGSGYGQNAGLKIKLKTFTEYINYICTGPIQGFKLVLHNPAELPRFSQHYIRIPLSQQVLVAIKPKMITTSEGLRPYEAERRLCYFANQRYLQYYKVYTKNNCQMECLANFTYQVCGCVHFGLPHGPDMKVCDASRLRCLNVAQKMLLGFEMQTEIKSETYYPQTEAHAIAARCKCLPACTSLEYDAETSQAEVNLKEYVNSFGSQINIENIFLTSSASIYFKEAEFITSRRSELYGQTEFLANCGGLLGLFMGFSILSVAEVVYFLTLRLWYLLRRHHNNNSTKNGVPNSKPKIAFE